MRLRALGRTTAGTAHIIGDTANNVMTNSSGDTINLSIDNTVNQTGTAGHTDLLINRTETAAGSGTQRLIDAQVDSVSQFYVDNAGNLTAVGTVSDGDGELANLASPAFTGTPSAPTATAGTSTTQLATTAFVQTAVAGAGGGDVSAVNTPAANQIAVWTGTNTIEGDANFTWDGTNLSITGNVVSPTLTGTPTAPTQATGNSSTRVATTEFVQQELDNNGVTPPGTANTITTNATTIYQFPYNDWHGGEFLVTVHDTTNDHRQISKLIITHDGTTACGTEYARVETNGELASLDVDVVSGQVRIRASAASSNSTNYVIQPVLLAIS